MTREGSGATAKLLILGGREQVTCIRVNPPLLKNAAEKIRALASDTRSAGDSANSAASGAPSYDGQFGPKVAALGAEAKSRASAIANSLNSLATRLDAKADDFIAADAICVEEMQSITLPPPPLLITPILPSYGTTIETTGVYNDTLTIPPYDPFAPPSDYQDNTPWWAVELVVGLLPFGDGLDIIKQVINMISGSEVDELVLALAVVGLVADLGWLQPIPSAEDAPNAVLAALKALAKQIPAGPARDALAELVEQAAKNPDDLKRIGEALSLLSKNSDILNPLLKNPEALVWALRVGPEAIETIAKHGDDGAALVARYGEPGLELLLKKGDNLTVDQIKRMAELPIQRHHILSDKNMKKWTPIFREIVDDYGLDMSKGDWNLIDMAHRGNHAEEYHEWVYNQLTEIDRIADGDPDTFLELFDEFIRTPLKENPLLVRREWWQ